MRNTNDIETRYRAFRVTYHGPGNVRGSRITIHDTRHGNRVRISYDDSGGDSEAQAIAHLEKQGIKVEALALEDFGAGIVLLSSNFQIPLKGVQS